jgi:NAD(P)-dependent dehydrogenase (short-subunit alcohol dehydrogenase family)
MTEQKPADSSNQKSYLPQGERPWPAKRAGDEADIVSTVIYLASNGGNFHNGHTIYLDGGELITCPVVKATANYEWLGLTMTAPSAA